jgi:hypothetical protein
MIIFAGIDGTGDWSNSKYRQTFANSHVNKLSRGEGLGGAQAWISDPFYHRGPRLFGNDTFFQAIKVYNHVVTQLIANPGAGVFLSGYSRGGAAVIAAARWMKLAGYAVDALFLFDAVDRAVPVNGYTISSNVKQVYHARRDPQAKSRESFGNCGCMRENSSKTGYEERFFFATHGGLGGMPWDQESVPIGEKFIGEGLPDGLTAVTPSDDKSGSDQVWAWMLTRVRRECARLCPAPMSLLG